MSAFFSAFGSWILSSPACRRYPSRAIALFLFRLHRGEQQHVADGGAVRQEHHQAVDAHPHAPGRRHAVLQRREKILVYHVGLLVAFRAQLHLAHEAGALVDGVVQLGVGVRQLQPAGEKLEPLDHLGHVPLALGQRGDLHGVVVDERGLDQPALHFLVEREGHDVAPPRAGLRLQPQAGGRRARLFGVAAEREEVDARGLPDGLVHADAAERRREVELFALVGNAAGAARRLRAGAEQALGPLHHAAVVGVGLVHLQRGELRVVPHVHPLVAEDAADFIHALHAAHNQALEVQFRRDAQVHVDVQRVVVGDERPRGRPAGDGVEDRGLHLDVAQAVQHGADGADDAAAADEGLLHLRVDNQVDVSLAVAQVGVLQAVELLRHGEQRLRQQADLPRMDGDFAPARLEHVPLHADDVADIPVIFEVGVARFPDLVDFQINLDAAGAVVQVHEAGLAHVAPAHDAPRDADVPVFQLGEAVADFPRRVVARAGRNQERVLARPAQARQLFAPDFGLALVPLFRRALRRSRRFVAHLYFPAFQNLRADKKRAGRSFSPAPARHLFGNGQNLVLHLSRRHFHFDLIPDGAVQQSLSDGRFVRNAAVQGVRLVGADDFVIDDLAAPGLRVHDAQLHFRPHVDVFGAELALVEHLDVLEHGLDVRDARFHNGLLVLRLVVLAVFGQVPEREGNLNFFGHFLALDALELVKLGFHLFKSFFCQKNLLYQMRKPPFQKGRSRSAGQNKPVIPE